MSVIVTGMGMPETCLRCPIRTGDYCGQMVYNEKVKCYVERLQRHPDCPMKSVEGLIEKIKEASFEHYFEFGEYFGEDTQKRTTIWTDRVIEVIKEYCGMEVDDGKEIHY